MIEYPVLYDLHVLIKKLLYILQTPSVTMVTQLQNECQHVYAHNIESNKLIEMTYY